MSDLITPALVRLDAGLGEDKEAVIRALADVVRAAGRTSNSEQLVDDVLAREGTSATGLPGGIAIPHCRTAAVSEPTLAFARLSPGVDFGAKDGPADLAFLIAAPEGGGSEHLTILAQLARSLAKADFTTALRGAATPEDAAALINGAVAPAPTAEPATPAAPAGKRAADVPVDSPSGASASLVAVTACPTGIAHTYMAAEALEAAAARAGVAIQARRARRRWPGRPSPTPAPSSSPSTWASVTGSGSPASRWSPPGSSAPSTTPTRWSPRHSPPRPTRRRRASREAWTTPRARRRRRPGASGYAGC